jgi:ATP-binding cassette, subfamily C (CFTR/MRP), member 1
MQLIDMELPINGAQFVTGAFSCVAKLIILCVVGKYLAVSVPFVLGVLFLVQRYYLRTSSRVRLVDIEAKAPLYAHFLETIQGLSTIHAFQWESRFRDENKSKLNESQRPFYMLFCIHIWLQLVLDLIVGAITVVIVATMTSMRDRFPAGSIGVALNLVLTLNQSLTQMIQSWTTLETSIGAVTRVRDFVASTPSELSSLTTPSHVQPEWPSHGAIEFVGVTGSYRYVDYIRP